MCFIYINLYENIQGKNELVVFRCDQFFEIYFLVLKVVRYQLFLYYLRVDFFEIRLYKVMILLRNGFSFYGEVGIFDFLQYISSFFFFYQECCSLRDLVIEV